MTLIDVTPGAQDRDNSTLDKDMRDLVRALHKEAVRTGETRFRCGYVRTVLLPWGPYPADFRDAVGALVADGVLKLHGGYRGEVEIRTPYEIVLSGKTVATSDQHGEGLREDAPESEVGTEPSDPNYSVTFDEETLRVTNQNPSVTLPPASNIVMGPVNVFRGLNRVEERTEAVKVAGEVLRSRGPFGQAPGSAEDVMTLADYILTGVIPLVQTGSAPTYVHGDESFLDSHDAGSPFHADRDEDESDLYVG